MAKAFPVESPEQRKRRLEQSVAHYYRGDAEEYPEVDLGIAPASDEGLPIEPVD